MGLLDQSFFDDIAPQNSDSTNEAGKVNVTIRVDGDCFLMCDGDFIDAEFKANKITKVELNAGQHILEFQSAADTSNVVEKIVDYSENGKSYLLIVQGLGEKSKEAKLDDTIAEFNKQIQLRLDDDRRIDGKEATELEEIRKKIGLDIKTAQTLINDARRQLRQDSRSTVVRDGSSFSIDILKDAIFKNDADKIRTILPDVAATIESSDQESDESKAIQCLYYMCMTALDPKALIQMHESSYVDNYWRAYWVFIAYSRNKQRAKAADTLADLQDIYLDYPDDNIDMLRAIDAYNNIGKEEAMKCANWVDGNFSTELVQLAEAVKYELGIAKPASRQKALEHMFIQDHVVSFEDEATRATFRAREKEALRRQVTYTLNITGIKDQMLAMMTARTALGWASSVSRQKFADLPFEVLVTNDKSKALAIYESLTKGGIIVSATGVNALNENVENCLEPSEQEAYLKGQVLFQEAQDYASGNNGKSLDPERAISLYKESARLGYILALYELGECYSENYGVETDDEEEELEYCRKFIKAATPIANDGDVSIMRLIGDCYHTMAADCVEGAEANMFSWYEKAVKQGSLSALMKMFMMFEYYDYEYEEKYEKLAEERFPKFFQKAKQGDQECLEILPELLFYVKSNDVDWTVDITEAWNYMLDIAAKKECSLSHWAWSSIFDIVDMCDEESDFKNISKIHVNAVRHCGESSCSPHYGYGLYRKEKNDKCGLVNENYEEVTPCIYNYISRFRDGMAEVRLQDSNKYGFLDSTGKLAVPCIYDSVDDFENGKARVEQNGKEGFIDKSGNWLS